MSCTHDEKDNYHDFVAYPEILSNCIAWISTWMEQKGYVTSSYNVAHDGKKKNPYHDFVTYPEVLTKRNQKGYVTSSYNVKYDGQITITILLHIPKYSATELHGLQPG